MLRSPLDPDAERYLRECLNKHLSVPEFALRKHPFHSYTNQELTLQYQGLSIAQRKLPTWFNTMGVLYPPKLNLEQTSSERTAQYKSQLVSGNTLADLTGGFGVDSYYFSRQFKQVWHCELNEELSRLAALNFKQLQASSVQAHFGDGMAFIRDIKADTVYIDPSRRDSVQKRVFQLSDCVPHVPENLEYIFDHTETVLIKTSPLLDIQLGLRELQFVAEIHIISVRNEVKELVWILRQGSSLMPSITTVNLLSGNDQILKFPSSALSKSVAIYGEPSVYLYEPNASLLKSGAFTYISAHFNVNKLHPNTHLYTSEKLQSFPGRRFRIKEIIPYRGKKTRLPNQAHITTRNFPETVSQLRKKLNIKEGGSEYLFFCTLTDDKKVILHCEKA